jgi:hypothetical protein
MGTPQIYPYQLKQKISRFVFRAPSLFATAVDDATDKNKLPRVLDHLNGVTHCEFNGEHRTGPAV